MHAEKKEPSRQSDDLLGLLTAQYDVPNSSLCPSMLLVSYEGMRDAYRHFREVMSEGYEAYEAEQSVTRAREDPLGLKSGGKKCKAECYCLLSPALVMYWITIPVQVLGGLLLFAVVCSSLFKGVEVVFPQDGDSRR